MYSKIKRAEVRKITDAEVTVIYEFWGGGEIDLLRKDFENLCDKYGVYGLDWYFITPDHIEVFEENWGSWQRYALYDWSLVKAIRPYGTRILLI
jgi:hypothetical protein